MKMNRFAMGFLLLAVAVAASAHADLGNGNGATSDPINDAFRNLTSDGALTNKALDIAADADLQRSNDLALAAIKAIDALVACAKSSNASCAAPTLASVDAKLKAMGDYDAEMKRQLSLALPEAPSSYAAQNKLALEKSGRAWIATRTSFFEKVAGYEARKGAAPSLTDDGAYDAALLAETDVEVVLSMAYGNQMTAALDQAKPITYSRFRLGSN